MYSEMLVVPLNTAAAWCQLAVVVGRRGCARSCCPGWRRCRAGCRRRPCRRCPSRWRGCRWCRRPFWASEKPMIAPPSSVVVLNHTDCGERRRRGDRRRRRDVATRPVGRDGAVAEDGAGLTGGDATDDVAGVAVAGAVGHRAGGVVELPVRGGTDGGDCSRVGRRVEHGRPGPGRWPGPGCS